MAPVPVQSPGYMDSESDFRYPTVFAHGTATGEHDGGQGGVVMFPMTTSDYVRGSTKQTTLACVLRFRLWSLLTYIFFFSWRMDERTHRWRNVPPPNKNEQITLSGTCYQMLPDGNLCVDLDSIALPSSMRNLANSNTPVSEMTVRKRRKFVSRAPPRTVMPVGVESNGQTLYGFLPKSVWQFRS